jgi:hypothetical protein
MQTYEYLLDLTEAPGRDALERHRTSLVDAAIELRELGSACVTPNELPRTDAPPRAGRRSLTIRFVTPPARRPRGRR